MALIHTVDNSFDIYKVTVEQDTIVKVYKVCGSKLTKVTEITIDAFDTSIITFPEDGQYNIILTAEGETDVTLEHSVYFNLLNSIIVDIETYLSNIDDTTGCEDLCLADELKNYIQYNSLFVKLMTFQSLYFDSIVDNLSLAFNTFLSDSVKGDRCKFQTSINKILKEECIYGSSTRGAELFTEFVSLYYYATYFIEKNLAQGDEDKLAYLEDKFNVGGIVNAISGNTCLDFDDVESVFDNALSAVNTKPTVSNVIVTPPNNLVDNIFDYDFSASDFTLNYADVQGDAATYIKFSVLPVRGTFTYDGNPVQLGIDYLVSNSALFKYVATINETRTIFDIIVFQIGDNNTLKLYSDMAHITFNTAAYVNQPISQLGDLTLNKNNRQNHVFTINDFTTNLNPPYVDPEGDSLDAIRIDSLPAAGQLQLSGNPVSAGDIIPAASINSGLFVMIAADQDASGSNTATFSARDSGSLQWVS